MDMIEGIQPNWLVVDNFGEEIGRVVAVNGPNLRVKLYGGNEIDIPGSDCALVETGRIELSKSKKDVEARVAAART